MTRRRLGMAGASALVLAVTLVLGCMPLPAAAADDTAACVVPDSLVFVDTPLPHVAQALQAGRPLKLVVFGTSSSMPQTKGLPRSYAAGLQAALESRLPGAALQIDNLSEKTQTATQMADRLAKSVLPLKPDLVLWQTGNVDAAQQIDVNDFSAALEAGLAALRAADVDTVLVAPQFRMRLSVMVDVAPYDGVMGQIADAEDIIVFPRFDIMRYWADHETFDTRTSDLAAQLRIAEAQNRCLASLLADMIARAARLPPP